MDIKQPLIGIIGGMGAFSSLEFMDTIYKFNRPYISDQQAPRIICVSDTNIHDRTSSILHNCCDSLPDSVNSIINKLLYFEIDIIVIACITFHFYFKLLPPEIQEKTVNLIDIIKRELKKHNKSAVLLATLGTYKSGIINGKNVIIPSLEQQRKIHSLIYEIKKVGKDPVLLDELMINIENMKNEFRTNLVIAGCTEIHIAVKYFKENKLLNDITFIDPLFTIGVNINNILSLKKGENF
ncbi:hypothetical protein XO10_01375 [Marinitoga sp. 1135]|uniref:aspartate/glutamate racemase family protein n=1 Tax=unclassified Marinitoga TaxID=2640159 RepID=UPI00095074DD|nr:MULTISPECIES: amino acid racemase [unclassified Marinitoga]APT75180.1 hypothetical protein LN42_01290 [Marinitoga sp. 1137]NUU94954.1 hypothetical protein [Marinitoga sp. 1135]NUU96923.1 hypothetical protein [Marinitoga sp. 1138]